MDEFPKFDNLTVAVDTSGIEVEVDQDLRLPVELKNDERIVKIGDFYMVICRGVNGNDFRSVIIANGSNMVDKKIDPQNIPANIINALREAVLKACPTTPISESHSEAPLASA